MLADGAAKIPTPLLSWAAWRRVRGYILLLLIVAPMVAAVTVGVGVYRTYTRIASDLQSPGARAVRRRELRRGADLRARWHDPLPLP